MLDWLTGRIMLPPEGSAYAGEVDTVFLGLYWLSQVLFWGITIAAIYFAWKYKYKAGRRTPHQTHNTNLEVIWSVGPTLLCVGIFFWGLNGYMKYAVAPGDAMEIVVTGKQWLWQFEYPDGSRTVNDLHVPVNTPIRLVMTSEDVLHDFFIPDMRVKHDVVPGRYTSIWFTPNKVGTHNFTCAEYCGRDHSGMHGEMTVESAEDFAVFQATGGTEFEGYFNGETGTPADWGAIQYQRKGCSSCHSVDGTASKGPTWLHMYDSQVELADGTTVTADARYLQRSMMQPNAQVVKGFDPIMPTFQGLLREHELRGLVAYIESLK